MNSRDLSTQLFGCASVHYDVAGGVPGDPVAEGGVQAQQAQLSNKLLMIVLNTQKSMTKYQCSYLFVISVHFYLTC